MNIPFFDLHRQYTEISDEIEKKVNAVMRSGQYIEGPATQELECNLTEYLNVKHVITCGNGTDALRIALQAVGVNYGDEVITTAFSFFATAEAIAQIGAIPVFADINPWDFNINAGEIRRKITDKTRAILPVHIFGMPADMQEINVLAQEYGIPVIEDACQAIGAEYHGKRAGTLGKAGCFSFYSTKKLGALGDGGMIATNDDSVEDICRALKSHAAGRTGAKAFGYIHHQPVPGLNEIPTQGDGLYDPCKYYNYLVAGNSRMDSMQAAALTVKLKYLEAYNRKRTDIARRYSEKLTGLPLTLPNMETDDRKSCWHQYVVLCDRKEKLIRHLGVHGIGAGNFYPVPIHRQKAFWMLGYEEGALPVTEDVCRKTVCLPIFPELTREEQDYIIDGVRSFFE